MNAPDDIVEYLSGIVARELPQVDPQGLRDWVAKRVVPPYRISLFMDPEGLHEEEFWMVTDHKDGKKGYRIAYYPVEDAFGIVTSLQSDIEWYMGTYGTFKETVDAL